MRSILTAFFLLFTVHSCFAGKLGSDKPVSFSKPLNNTKISARFISHKVHEDQQWIRLETSPNRHQERNPFNPFLQGNTRHFDATTFRYFKEFKLKLYTADPALNYKFIFHLLYPKHSFW